MKKTITITKEQLTEASAKAHSKLMDKLMEDAKKEGLETLLTLMGKSVELMVFSVLVSKYITKELFGESEEAENGK